MTTGIDGDGTTTTINIIINTMQRFDDGLDNGTKCIECFLQEQWQEQQKRLKFLSKLPSKSNLIFSPLFSRFQITFHTHLFIASFCSSELFLPIAIQNDRVNFLLSNQFLPLPLSFLFHLISSLFPNSDLILVFLLFPSSTFDCFLCSNVGRTFFRQNCAFTDNPRIEKER